MCSEGRLHNAKPGFSDRVCGLFHEVERVGGDEEFLVGWHDHHFHAAVGGGDDFLFAEVLRFFS